MSTKKINEDLELEQVELKPKKDNFEQEIQELVFKYKNIVDELDLRTFKNNLQVLKTKNKDNKNNYKRILEFEYSRKLIKDNSAEASLLNQWEYEAAPLKCLYEKRIGSSGFRTELGKTYPCKRYFDETRQRDVFTIFVDIEVTPDEQISKELSWKMKNGFMPSEKDFLPARTIFLRYALNEKEFYKYFKII